MVDAAWFAHYEPNVPHSLAYPSRPLQHILEDTARRYPHKVATKLILKYLLGGRATAGGSLSYAELDDHADRFAAALAGLGVKKGDRVALMLPNSPQFVIAFFGVLKAGGVAVNLNPSSTPQQLKQRLNDAGVETMVLLNLFCKRLEQVKAETGIKRVVVTHMFDLLHAPSRQLVRRAQQKQPNWAEVAPGRDLFLFEALLSQVGTGRPEVEVNAEDVAVLQYTGGTADASKAAMLTHRNLVANTLQVVAFLPQLEPGKEKVMASIPFFYIYGTTVVMNFAIYTGAQLLLVPDPRPVDTVTQIIAKEGATVFPGMPTTYIDVLDHPHVTEFDLRSIKACISGPAPLPLEVQDRFESLTGGRLVESYGLTEASPVTHCNPVFGERRAGSIGLPLPDVEARIVDPTTGLPILWHSDEPGELLVRGPNVMKGYWNRPNQTMARIDEDGWLYTGDIARMDRDGYFYIVGRKRT